MPLASRGCSRSAICMWPSRRTARSSRISAPDPMRTGSCWPGMSGSCPRTSSGRCAPSANGSPRWYGPRATMTCGRTATIRSGCAARNVTCSWWSCAGAWASSPRRILPRVGPGRAARPTIAPLFLLYDYSFRPDGALTKEQGLAVAYESGIVCSDEALLYPDPYPSREAWCWARVEATERRLAALDPALPVVLMNHYPLVREPTRVLRYPQFAQWCGTTRTRDWHTRFNAASVVYGHLHIPRV